MSTQEGYRRLLRWYPRSWRDAHGEVALGTMLDLADSENRMRPTAREHVAAAIYGLGARLTLAAALGSALIGLVLAAVAGLLAVWGASALAVLDASWALPVLTGGVVPLFTAFSLIAIARDRGFISSPSALAILVLAAVALSLGVLAQTAWSLGFDFADEGVAATGLATLFRPLFVAGWLFGATAIAALLAGMLSRTSIPRGFVILLSAICGLIAAPFAGVSLLSPIVSLIIVAAGAIAALTLLARGQAAEDGTARPATNTATQVPARTLRTAKLLIWMSLLTSLFGIIYALTGSSWAGAASDGTLALTQGFTICALAGLPLLGAIAVKAGGVRRSPTIATLVPLVLLALSLCAIALSYVFAPSWNAMAPALAIAAALTGAAIAWWLARQLHGPATARLLSATFLGIGYAAFLGVMLAAVTAPLVPMVAAAYAIWGTRSLHSAQPRGYTNERARRDKVVNQVRPITDA
ncbi:hypothetical protein [Microbacterium marmarense]|uniref:Uncharacterized protein n=1 Tax=Microbacterium marmarense TaxID=3122051 RepID=A0ABU8LT44_9MICO